MKTLGPRLRIALAGAVFAWLGCEGELQVEPPPRTLRALQGPLQLIGSSTSTCSHGLVGNRASGDRWCGFARPAPGLGTQGTELWAINVSRALAGGREIPCDGSSPHCVLLTSTLWSEQPLFQIGHPYIHGFTGDTLVFYADALNKDPEDGYHGPVRAWRPGMASPRQLTDAKGFSCSGHLRSDGVLCLANETGFGPALEFDLLAGYVGPGAGGPLPLLRRVKPYGTRRAPTWQVAFSPGGESLLLSTEAPDAPQERLEIIATGDVGKAPPRELLRNLSRWEVSGDGKKIFYLDGYAADLEGDGMGTLTVADFPTMANPVQIEKRVGAYETYGPRGGAVRGLSLLSEMDGGGGTFRVIADISRPANIVTIDQGIRDPRVSPDLRYSVYDGAVGAEDAITYLAHNGGDGRCALTDPGTTGFGVVFAGATRQVFWLQSAPGETGKFESWVADPQGCQGRRRFADNMAFMRATRTGLLHGVEEDSPATMAVYYTPLADPEPKPVLLARQVDPQVVVLDERYLVFTISGSSPDAGLWIHGPVR